MKTESEKLDELLDRLDGLNAKLNGLDEIVERTRRTETRLTKYMESKGFDSRVQRAVWTRFGTVAVPSPAIAFTDILKAIPPGLEAAVSITWKGNLLGSVKLPPNSPC